MQHYQISTRFARSFVRNTFQHFKSVATDTLFLRPHETPPSEMALFNCHGKDALQQWGIGCDRDIGGYSTANISLGKDDKLKFHGNISLALSPSSDAIYTGYAALRTRMRLPQHLFDDRSLDCSRYRFLVMRVKGDHRSYSINFKTSGSLSGDLYSCKFKFLKPYEWEEIILPFNYFIRTNCGVEYMRQYAPNMAKIQSFGFLLADNLPGPYNLEVDYIKASNLDGEYDLMNEEVPEYRERILNHVFDIKKKRQDWVDGPDNHFGFGFDAGPGMMETAESHVKSRFTSKHNFLNQVRHSDFEIIVNPDRKKERVRASK